MEKNLSNLEKNNSFQKKWNILSVVLLVGVFAILICALVKSSEYRDSSIAKSAEIEGLNGDILTLKKDNYLVVSGLRQGIDSLSNLQSQKDSVLRIKDEQIAHLKNSFKLSTNEWIVKLAERDTLLAYAYRLESSFLRTNRKLEYNLDFVTSERDILMSKNISLKEKIKEIAPLKKRLEAHKEFLDYLSKWDKNVTNFRDSYIYDGRRGVFQRNVESKNIIIK